MLTRTQREFLHRMRVGRLATADAQASPHVVPVCYVVDGDCAYITVDRKPKQQHGQPLKRIRNIIDNPSVALVVDRYDEDWGRLGWVMLRGRASVIEAGEEHDRAQAMLAGRYTQYADMALDDLPVISIRIERVNAWGYLGKVDE